MFKIFILMFFFSYNFAFPASKDEPFGDCETISSTLDSVFNDIIEHRIRITATERHASLWKETPGLITVIKPLPVTADLRERLISCLKKIFFYKRSIESFATNLRIFTNDIKLHTAIEQYSDGCSQLCCFLEDALKHVDVNPQHPKALKFADSMEKECQKMQKNLVFLGHLEERTSSSHSKFEKFRLPTAKTSHHMKKNGDDADMPFTDRPFLANSAQSTIRSSPGRQTSNPQLTEDIASQLSEDYKVVTVHAQRVLTDGITALYLKLFTGHLEVQAPTPPEGHKKMFSDRLVYFSEMLTFYSSEINSFGKKALGFTQDDQFDAALENYAQNCEELLYMIAAYPEENPACSQMKANVKSPAAKMSGDCQAALLFDFFLQEQCQIMHDNLHSLRDLIHQATETPVAPQKKPHSKMIAPPTKRIAQSAGAKKYAIEVPASDAAEVTEAIGIHKDPSLRRPRRDAGVFLATGGHSPILKYPGSPRPVGKDLQFSVERSRDFSRQEAPAQVAKQASNQALSLPPIKEDK